MRSCAGPDGKRSLRNIDIIKNHFVRLLYFRSNYLWRGIGRPDPKTTDVPAFSDVKETDYYYEAVRWAASYGITTGYTGTDKFGPDDPCTRAQIVTFLYRFNQVVGWFPDETAENTFSDVKDGQFYTKPVLWAVNYGITTGYTGTDLFGTNDICTCGQVVTFIYRMD